MSGRSAVLEYVSDGMENGDDANISVNKLFEEYLYAYIRYSLLNGKLGVQEISAELRPELCRYLDEFKRSE